MFVLGAGSALFVLTALMGACSDGDEPSETKAKSTTTTAPTSGSGKTEAFVDVVECESSSGSGTSKGTITNDGAVDTAYEITIAFRDASGEEIATGSTTTESAPAGGEVGWTVEVSGLGPVTSEDLSCNTVSVKPVKGGTPTTSDSVGSSDGEFPCGLLSADEVAQILGNPLDGDAITSPTTEGDLSWTARQCVWSGPPSTTTVEMTLSVSRPEDFPAGTSSCPPPIGTTTPVAGIGDSATWSWTDPGTEETVGELRVCSPGGFVVVRMSGMPDGPQQQQMATAVAEKVLAGL